MRRLVSTLATFSMLVVACGDGVPAADPTGAPASPSTPSVDVPTEDDDAPAGPGADAPAPTATPAAEDATAAPARPFRADTADDSADGRGSVVTVTDVRVGHHDGFDRVVFDTGGDGTAGWHVGYVDEAVTQGAGERLELEGEAILQVDLVHTGYPDDTGTPVHDGPRRLRGPDVVAEVAWVGVFEGRTQAFVGLTSERPFRVFRLGDRVVLDVWQEGIA